jgi:hypothetical protein
MHHGKIKKNFLVVSNYNNAISWIPEYTDRYVIYDRSENTVFPDRIDQSKVIKSPNVGYNSYDYFRFIVDNYDNLPEVTIFAKGHSFPRHVSQAYFDSVMNNRTFTPLMDKTQHAPKMPISFIKDGLYHELNNSWYFQNWASKYFTNYNDFLRYVYKNPVLPEYVAFAPGGDHVVPRENILKLPKRLYENMMVFMSHCREPVETHMIERACNTLWTADWEINHEAINQPIKEYPPEQSPFRRQSRGRRAFDLFMKSSYIPPKLKQGVLRAVVSANAVRTKYKNRRERKAV